MGDFLTILFALAAGGFGYLAYRLRHNLWEAQVAARQRERERATVFRFLNRLGESITTTVDLEATLDLVVDFCIDATKADAGAVFIRSTTDPTILQARVVHGLFPPLHEVASDKLISKRKYLAEYVKKETLRVGEGVIGRIAQTGEAVLITDAANDARVPKSASELVELHDLILAPLVVRGAVAGVLALINKRAEGQVFNEADRDLVTALADQAAVTLDIVRLYEELSEKQRLEQELRIAHDVQETLLPRRMPVLGNIEIAGLSRAAADVGGDYYDFIEVDETHLGIVVADVAGKGIPGALVMATLRSSLRAEARGDASPRNVMRRVNRLLVHDTRESVFVSVLYGVLDVITGEFVFVRAGHEPLIACSKDPAEQPQLLSPEGMVAGMIDGTAFDTLEEARIRLDECGAVVLNTDGATEAMSRKDEEFGMDRLVAAIHSRQEQPPREIIAGIVQEVDAFTGDRPQHDDITLVVMRWKADE